MGLHVQQQVVFVLGLLAAHGTLELGIDAALEPDVPAEAVQPGVRIAAPGARVRRGRRRIGECRPAALRVPAAAVDPHPVGRGTCRGKHSVGTIKNNKRNIRFVGRQHEAKRALLHVTAARRGRTDQRIRSPLPHPLATGRGFLWEVLPDAAEFSIESNFRTKKKKLTIMEVSIKKKIKCEYSLFVYIFLCFYTKHLKKQTVKIFQGNLTFLLLFSKIKIEF